MPVVAAPGGELDSTFGDHGRVLLLEPHFDERAGIEVFPEQDGTSFVAVASGYYVNAVLRFSGDGSLDPSFGDRGEVQLDFGDDYVQIFDAERDAGGKLLVAGAVNVYGTPDNVVHGSAILARMLENGTPDPTFGNNGRARFDYGGVYEALSQVLLQADGRIVVYGISEHNGSTEWVLARYTKNGVADVGFGTGPAGTARIDIEGVDEILYDVVQSPDGSFIACGSGKATSDSLTKAIAVRLQSQGDLDTTYGDKGTALIGAARGSLVMYTCLALADGHLVMAGTLTESGAQRGVVLRLTPHGKLDPDFGDRGMTILPTDLQSAAYVLRLLDDGYVAVGGTQRTSQNRAGITVTDLLVARIDPITGALDHDFGDRGKSVVDLGAGGELSNAALSNIRQLSDGKLLVIGAQYYRGDWWDWPKIALTRIDPNGSGSNGWAGLRTTFVSFAPGGGTADLLLRRTGGSTGELSVDYRTVDGSAIAGTDYVSDSGTIAWADGDMSDKSLQFTALNNPAATGNSSFRVELQNSSGGLATSEAHLVVSVRATSGGGSGGSGGGGGAPVGPSKSGGGGAVGIELGLMLAALLMLAAINRRRESRIAACVRAE